MYWSFLLLACFPEITKIEEERFPENPNHDYDEDGISDAEDCDDANSDIGRPLTYYADSDGDGFGVESQSVLSCPAEKPDGYIEAKERLGVVVFDCDDDNSAVNPDAEEVCDFIDNDCDDNVDEDVSEAPLWYLDDDGDGYGDFDRTLTACADENDLGPDRYVSNFADCDDNNASVYPNADEYCNDVDDNCNGLIDEALSIDAQLWYQDSDEDGFGSRNSVQPSCEQPTGFVLDATDCNDTDAMINNDAVETCNGLDDNCNGLVDEGADSTAPLGSSTFYADNDGDGYGDPSTTLLQCNVASGFVSNADDCDDGNGTAYPNAPETCNGVDDDCDGSTDESDAIDKSEWFADSDGDGYGTGGTSQFACNQPAGFVSQSGDCDDVDGTVLPTATEVCDGVDNNCDGLVDDADANLDLNTATEYFQDADFDGYGDPLQSTFSCLQTPGFVANSDDCDDGNLLRNPDGFEYCNNIDDNCDGTIDELAVDSTDYFVDADGDGHGALVDTTTGFDLNSCPTFDPITNLPVNPTGYAPTDDDCDDGDATISPSASELCTNGIDENCDGHNTAGATDVTTFLVDADGDTFGSGERDSNGDLAYALDLCVQPYGYVPYSVNDSLDCDDGDADVKPGALELCNGQLDNCASDGSTTVPSDELDDDGDGFVECTLDIDSLQWADLTLGIVGGDDCDDNDAFSYPDAPELCNGAFEDCNDPLYIAQSQSAPDDEIDYDGDCFVECYGFDATSWEGGIHSCEHLDSTGQTIQETVVIGGEDCNDTRADTYPGAALNSPDVCSQDLDDDGEPDCNLEGIHPDYECDMGVFLSNGGVGPDFVLIPSGTDPLGRYTITNDFYMMTTEVTESMYNALMFDDVANTSLTAKSSISWNDAALFANYLSVMTGREECYSCSEEDPVPTNICIEVVNPYQCRGFVLPTEAEWEYAARSGTTNDCWTGQGTTLGGSLPVNGCNGSEVINDGATNPLLNEYMWYCGNNTPSGVKPVAQKLPNGFGLYDMQGNVFEWAADFYCNSIPQTNTDPYCDFMSANRIKRSGYYGNSPSALRLSTRGFQSPATRSNSSGVRLVLHR